MRLLTRKPKQDNPNPELERKRGTCLATWWHQASPGTTYWRCLVPARHLPGQTLPVTPKDLSQDKHGQVIFPRQRGDAAIWQFLGDDARSRIAFAMKDMYGTKLLLEVDDNYTRVAPYMRRIANAPWRESIAEAGRGYSHEMHRLLLPAVDGIICATEYLADIYSEFNDNVFVCPNSIDPDDWDFPRAEPDEIFRIVYYGSPSHIKDAPIVTDALKWASKQPNVEIWTVGFKNPSWSFPYQTVPWTDDLVQARKQLFRFDLGIAPLKANPWANGKSDVKALEYAMAGVLPLMSHTEPFRPWFDDNMDLCLLDDEWLPTIKWAVNNQADARARAKGAKEWVLANRSIHKTIDTWREALA